MRILLTNDDGIHAPGIKLLARELAKWGEVIVVAPEREQSAIGHAITMHHPLRSKRIDFHGTGLEAWWVSGTPADCVKLANDFILKELPDIVVSGMNRGENLGKDVFYSGTVSAAIEGAFYGIRSFAVSYEDLDMKNGEAAAEEASNLIQKVAAWSEFPKGVVVNINIPKIKNNAGRTMFEITELGEKRYKNNFEERTDPRGNNYYWLVGEVDHDTYAAPGTDVFAMRNGKISVTPININFYNEILVGKLAEALKSKE